MAQVIRDIKVTLTAAPPDPEEWSYKRIRKLEKTNCAVYLWKSSHADAHEHPITDIQVLHDDEPIPAGFEKLSTDVNQTEPRPVFVAVQRDPTQLPIVDVKVIGADTAAGQGWIRIEKDVNRVKGQRVLFLCFWKGAAGSSQEISLQVGDTIDCKDTVNNWCTADIVDMNHEQNQVLVHYHGWSDKWNEWLPLASSRIALRRTHTTGDTGPKTSNHAFRLNSSERERMQRCEELMAEILETNAGSDGGFEWDSLPAEMMVNMSDGSQSPDFIVLATDLLTSVIDDRSMLTRVVCYFQMVLHVAVSALQVQKNFPHYVLQAAWLVVGGSTHNRRFFQKYGVHKDSLKELPGLDDAPHPRVYAARPKGSRSMDVSAYLVHLVNYFGAHGGFHAMLNRIRPSEEDAALPPLVLSNLRCALRLVCAVKSHLEPSFAKSFSTDLMNALCDRLRTLSDADVRHIDRNVYQDLMQEVSDSIQGAQMSSSELAEFTERLGLDMAFELVQCPLLAPKLTGVQHIKTVVVQTWNRETHASRKPMTRFISNKYLMKWIERVGLIRVLLNDHEEVIRRTPDVLKYLSLTDNLTAEHLTVLWECAVGKHESIVRIVYDAISDLTSSLSEAHLQLLFGRIKDIPREECTSVTMSFIKDFTSNGVARLNSKHRNITNQKNDLGLSLFWQWLQDDSAAGNTGFAHDAQECFIDLITSKHFQQFRVEYLHKCVDNLSQHTSVPQSLVLARTIIEMFAERSSRSNAVYPTKSTARLIDELLDKDVLRMLFDDLQLYRNKAVEASEARDDLSDRMIPDDTVLVGMYHHRYNLTSRLNFLMFLCHLSTSVVLDTDHMGVLWDVFVTSAVSGRDAKKLLSWMKSSCNASSNERGFSAEVIEHVFTSLLCQPSKLDPATIDQTGYDCFEAFFRCVNAAHDKLRLGVNGAFDVLQHDLLGLDSLWNVVMLAKSSLARRHGSDSDSASRFLINLYMRVDPQLDKIHMWRSFVDKCLYFLATAKDHVASEDSKQKEYWTQVLGRVFWILESFLERSEQKESQRRAVHTSLEVIVRSRSPHGKPEQRTNVKLSTSTTLMELRRYLCKHYQAYAVHFVYRNKPLYPRDWDHLTLQQSDVRGPLTATLLEGPSSEMTRRADLYQSRRPDHLYCRHVLSNDPGYFELLFQLLEVGGGVGQMVWKLLDTLPHNETISKQLHISASDSPDWNQVLNPNTLFRVLYSLQVVNRHLDRQKPERRDQWMAQFSSMGGLQHLYTLLVQGDVERFYSDELLQQCLASILKLVNNMSSRVADRDDELLCTRLLHFIHQACVFKVPVSQQLVVSPSPTSASSAARYGQHAEANTAVKDEPPSYQSEVIHQSATLLLHILADDAGLLRCIYNYPHLKEVFVSGLLENPVRSLRKEIKMAVQELCIKFDGVDADNRPETVLVPVLLSCLRDIDTGSPFCTEYFKLMEMLLHDQGDVAAATGAPGAGVDGKTREIVVDLVRKISEHPIQEVGVDDEPDRVLCGLFSLCQAFIAKHPSLKPLLCQEYGLAVHLFRHCLFSFPSSRDRSSLPPPKCKTSLCRKAAFDLLTRLCCGAHGHTAAEQLLPLLLPNHMQSHSGGARPHDWEFAAGVEQKSGTGYVGIKNPGCVCYMNSLLQQLFMMPRLRSGILSLPDASDDKSESFLFQLQVLLGYLQESERPFVDPRPFCHAFKDLDGNPTNLSEQMDANEFLSSLFDRVDELTKGGNRERVVQDVMQGAFANPIQCKQCSNVSAREEPFYYMTVDVVNKQSVTEALDAFVELQMLEGDNAYMCNPCGKKVDATKRQCLKRLPPVLCIHLKRFEFDFETMQRFKVNSRMDFPMTIDMKPYTLEGLAERDGNSTEEFDLHPDSYYEYHLVGVLVHTGQANRGHYYSFVKERTSGVGDTDTEGDGRWFEFNDTIVRDFNPAHIPRECFGGDDQGGSYEKQRNAYMIFYERVSAKLDVQPSSPSASDNISFPNAALTVSVARRLGRLKNKPLSSRVHVPGDIFSTVWQENLVYWRDRFAYDANYFQFLVQLVSGLVPASALDSFYGPPGDDVHFKVTELCARFALQTLSRARHKDDVLLEWFDVLQHLLDASLSCNYWLLDRFAHSVSLSESESESGSHDPCARWAYELLLESRSDDVRILVSRLLCRVLERLLREEKDVPVSNDNGHRVLGAAPSDRQQEEDDVVPFPLPPMSCPPSRPSHPLVSHAFVLKLLALLPHVPRNWKRMGSFFKVMRQFVSTSPTHALFLCRHGALAQLLDIFLGDESPHPDTLGVRWSSDVRGKTRNMGDGWNHPDCLHFFDVLSALLCCSTPTHLQSSEQLPSGFRWSQQPEHAGVTPHTLSHVEESFLSQRCLWKKLMCYATNAQLGVSVGDMVEHVCFANESFSEVLIGYISEAIEELDWEDIRPLFRVVQRLVCIEDGLQPVRIKLILSSLLNIMEEQARFWKATDLCIEHVIRLAELHPACYDYLHSNASRLSFLHEWLVSHERPPSQYSSSAIRLLKPHARDEWQKDYRSHAPAKPYGRDMYAKQDAIKAVFEGKPLAGAGVDGEDDSDVDLSQRVFTLDQEVEVADSAGKWKRGRVKALTASKVLIKFQGLQDRWNEWFPVDHPRVSPVYR